MIITELQFLEMEKIKVIRRFSSQLPSDLNVATPTPNQIYLILKYKGFKWLQCLISLKRI